MSGRVNLVYVIVSCLHVYMPHCLTCSQHPGAAPNPVSSVFVCFIVVLHMHMHVGCGLMSCLCSIHVHVCMYVFLEMCRGTRCVNQDIMMFHF